jgi:hypothetical protein
MAVPHYTCVTYIDGTAELRTPSGTRRRTGELLLVDDDHGAVRVVERGTDAREDLHIAGARRVGEALLWRNDRGETLVVVGTARPPGDALHDLTTGARAPQRRRSPAP